MWEIVGGFLVDEKTATAIRLLKIFFSYLFFYFFLVLIFVLAYKYTSVRSHVCLHIPLPFLQWLLKLSDCNVYLEMMINLLNSSPDDNEFEDVNIVRPNDFYQSREGEAGNWWNSKAFAATDSLRPAPMLSQATAWVPVLVQCPAELNLASEVVLLHDFPGCREKKVCTNFIHMKTFIAETQS